MPPGGGRAGTSQSFRWIKDVLDNLGILDAADHFHGTLTAGAHQRVRFVHFLDKSSPVFAAGLAEFLLVGL